MFGKPGSILLCISDLPARVSRKDLKHFVQDAADALRGGLRVTPTISDCSILRLTNPSTGAIRYQGLVAVQPARLALEVIRELQRRTLRGHRVEVHRYRHSTFDVDSATSTRSMSDLLWGCHADRSGQEATHARLELVADTGSQASVSAKSSKVSETRRPTGGILAQSH